MVSPLKIKPFDAAEFLDTDEAIAAFLSDALESGDSAVFQEALQIAARARGMSEVASAAGLGRESLYKALKPDAHPRFDTVQKVISALGISFKLSPAKSAQAKTKRRANPFAKDEQWFAAKTVTAAKNSKASKSDKPAKVFVGKIKRVRSGKTIKATHASTRTPREKAIG
jgi:probable addiction module antidote protein